MIIVSTSWYKFSKVYTPTYWINLKMSLHNNNIYSYQSVKTMAIYILYIEIKDLLQKNTYE